MTIGIPIKLLHESEGHTVTIELKSGEVYRGHLAEAEDNMNCQLKNVTLTAKDGKVTALELVYIRGSKIRYFIIPDMLKNAPMFKNGFIFYISKPLFQVDPSKQSSKGRGMGYGLGRGKQMLPK
jgi:small nuclear ribonucleoprotein D3